MDRPMSPDQNLVPIFETAEAATLLPIRAALEQAGIEFIERDSSLSSEVIGDRSLRLIGESGTALQILVRPDDVARATDVVRDATLPGVPVLPEAAPGLVIPATAGPDGFDLFDVVSGQSIGSLTNAQMAALAGALERESTTDSDYYVDTATVRMLQDAGVDPAIPELLRRALGERDGMDVRWRAGGRRA